MILASNNAHKLDEFRAIFADMGIEIIPQSAAGCDFEVDETGETFEENAYLKAIAVTRATGQPAVADDSGLMVDALGGAPGVYSSRYSGCHGDDRANRLLLLKNMEGQTDRRAYFQSAVALVCPDGRKTVAQGRTYGKILYEETGENGFGYDCIFESDDLGKSFGIASAEEKNAVSHRFRALQSLAEKLDGEL